VIYLIFVPDDLSGYEVAEGDFQQALLGIVEAWLGPDYEAYHGKEQEGVPACPGFEGERIYYDPLR